MQMPILDLRQAIIQRVHDKSQQELAEIIEDSIDADERALPGLGVLLELIWKDSDEAAHRQLVETLHGHLGKTAAPLQSPPTK